MCAPSFPPLSKTGLLSSLSLFKNKNLCVLISAPLLLCERIFCLPQSRGETKWPQTESRAWKTRKKNMFRVFSGQKSVS